MQIRHRKVPAPTPLAPSRPEWPFRLISQAPLQNSLACLPAAEARGAGGTGTTTATAREPEGDEAGESARPHVSQRSSHCHVSTYQQIRGTAAAAAPTAAPRAPSAPIGIW